MAKYGIIKNRWVVDEFDSKVAAQRSLDHKESIEGVGKSGKIIKL